MFKKPSQVTRRLLHYAIKQLEQKLNVTLIAYELAPSHHNHHEDTPIVINPSKHILYRLALV
ncbi:hypothetical protein [Solibacillus sp. FSL W7-1324]|uniref:hypothetical protein n=1 Tax=Solibacillus sp. FSL W7-1324 TaxID=2921701 RepID=UPI0030FA10C7